MVEVLTADFINHVLELCGEVIAPAAGHEEQDSRADGNTGQAHVLYAEAHPDKNTQQRSVKRAAAEHKIKAGAYERGQNETAQKKQKQK